MHWADINAALYKAGSSPGQAAKALGVQHNAVSQTIRGQIASYNIASHIAAVTNIPLNRLFPDGRYSQPPRRGRRSAA
ncbi:MAG TPA: hypothetical protein VIQ81_04070 [Gammaproteobacteria bacterium]